MFLVAVIAKKVKSTVSFAAEMMVHRALHVHIGEDFLCFAVF